MTCEAGRMEDECGCVLELVWDEDLNATAVTGEASPIRIGPGANLMPKQLLALAASSALMTSFLNLAADAGILVQGYVSSARFRTGADGEPELALAACAVVASEDDRLRAMQLWADALHLSRSLGLLRDRLRLDPEVRVAPPI